MGSLRIMTYNVKGLSLDADGVAEVIRSADAEIVAIQEPPLWWWGIRRFRRLARSIGYEAVTARGLARTTALLVRGDVLDEARHIRPVALSSRISRFRLGWPTPRGYSRMTIRSISVFNVHLSLFAQERAKHVDRIAEAVLQTGANRCVLVGDLNETPDGPAWAAFCPPLRDAGEHLDDPTFPAKAPKRRIDGVLVGEDFAVTRIETIRSDSTAIASDHLPIVVTVTCGPAARAIEAQS